MHKCSLASAVAVSALLHTNANKTNLRTLRNVLTSSVVSVCLSWQTVTSFGAQSISMTLLTFFSQRMTWDIWNPFVEEASCAKFNFLVQMLPRLGCGSFYFEIDSLVIFSFVFADREAHVILLTIMIWSGSPGNIHIRTSSSHSIVQYFYFYLFMLWNGATAHRNSVRVARCNTIALKA